MTLPSKELLSKVLDKKIYKIYVENEEGDNLIRENEIAYSWQVDWGNMGWEEEIRTINIYELAHLNLKQWAKLKNVFDMIDWSEEPEKIFAKAEELRNEIS